ncbi:MAG: chemotaxis protein CheW [Candidatus Latescibacter sp.]|nr:chemotaxis protein CheW [Candidatus Latescibacter sp.]
MSVGRFKSKDDYFSRKSGFAERIIQAKPQKFRKKALESNIPLTLLRVHFCKTVDSFEIEGEGRFRMGEYSLDDALSRHLAGDANVLVNPLSHTGETAFSLVKFDLSPEMDLPFSKARQYADELLKQGISSQIEVTGGGKGHYHVLIFHEEPIPGRLFSEALVRFGHELFGIYLDTVPPLTGDAYVPLPLQGEEVLLQRRVFVNTVGKMIKDQAHVLRTIEPCPKKNSEAFIQQISRTTAIRPQRIEPYTVPLKPESPAKTAPRIDKPPPLKEKPGKKVIILSFMRSGIEFGIETASVQEIIPAGEIVPTPGMTEHFCGMKKTDTRIIPVMDFGMLSGRMSSARFSHSRIIILGGEEAPGILADSISGPDAVDEGRIQPAGLSEYIRGKVLLEDGKRELLLLDRDKLFLEAVSSAGSEPADRALSLSKCREAGDLYVLFSHGAMLFGLAAHAIVEFLPPSTPGRDTPRCISTRGKLLPMADLPPQAGIAASGNDKTVSGSAKGMESHSAGSMRERILVVQNRSSTFCVKADNVTGIRNIPSFMIEPIPCKPGMGMAPFAGAARLSGDERFVLILDPDALGNMVYT